MTNKRPKVLTIAGFDPSAGAGVLADVKTFENIGVYGFAVTTSITYQNENKFDKANQKSNLSNLGIT